jgi:hydrogenase expression/formation protein HypC
VCLGIPGQIVELRQTGPGCDDPFPTAVVDYGGVRKQACLAYVPDAAVGEYVIVHVGFAISRIDEAEALRTLDVLRAMADQVAQEIGEPLR